MIIGAGQSLNTSSSLFQRSINEMKYLTKYFKGKETSTLGLAGVGDLYVSAAGGRNSKMGSYLGKGYTFKNAKKRFMPNDTVEGEQLVREIAPYVMRKINKKKKKYTFIDFDIPETLTLATYYLSKSFPENKVFLYGNEKLSDINIKDYDFILKNKLMMIICKLFQNIFIFLISLLFF